MRVFTCHITCIFFSDFAFLLNADFANCSSFFLQTVPFDISHCLQDYVQRCCVWVRNSDGLYCHTGKNNDTANPRSRMLGAGIQCFNRHYFFANEVILLHNSTCFFFAHHTHIAHSSNTPFRISPISTVQHGDFTVGQLNEAN